MCPSRREGYVFKRHSPFLGRESMWGRALVGLSNFWLLGRDEKLKAEMSMTEVPFSERACRVILRSVRCDSYGRLVRRAKGESVFEHIRSIIERHLQLEILRRWCLDRLIHLQCRMGICIPDLTVTSIADEVRKGRSPPMYMDCADATIYFRELCPPL